MNYIIEITGPTEPQKEDRSLSMAVKLKAFIPPTAQCAIVNGIISAFGHGGSIDDFKEFLTAMILCKVLTEESKTTVDLNELIKQMGEA